MRQTPRSSVRLMPRGLIAWLGAALHRRAVSGLECVAYDGFCLFVGSDNRAFVDAVTAALRLLQLVDARRYRRAQRHAPNLVRWPFQIGAGHYLGPGQAYYMESACETANPAAVAGSLVHEATHGYLAARGFRYWKARRRHERLCLTEQVRFLRRYLQWHPTCSEEEKRQALNAIEQWAQRAFASRWWSTTQRLRRIHQALYPGPGRGMLLP